MGSGHFGSPKWTPFAEISIDEGFKNSSAAMLAFTCQLSGMTISIVTLEPFCNGPVEYCMPASGGGMLFMLNSSAKMAVANNRMQNNVFCKRLFAKFPISINLYKIFIN